MIWLHRVGVVAALAPSHARLALSDKRRAHQQASVVPPEKRVCETNGKASPYQ